LSNTIPDAGVRVERGSAGTTRTDGDKRLDSGGCGLASTTVTLLLGVPDEPSREPCSPERRAFARRDEGCASTTGAPVRGVGVDVLDDGGSVDFFCGGRGTSFRSRSDEHDFAVRYSNGGVFQQAFGAARDKSRPSPHP